MITELWTLIQDPLAVLVGPVYVVALVAEIVLSRKLSLGWHEARDTLTSLAMLLLAAVVELLPKILALMVFLLAQSLSPLAEFVGRQWWAWLLLFLLDDLTYYWFHRLHHQVRLFWAGHISHHSSSRFHFATALRAGVGERVPKYLCWSWLPLLGFDVLMVLVMMALNQFYQFWLHTQAIDRLPGPVESLFNTPSHHRVHHASNVRYLDRNYGGVLIVWDRLFGTFQAELPEEPVVFGLTRQPPSQDPLTVAFHEYRALLADLRRGPGWRARWASLFAAPGWSPTGPDLRVATLRARAGLN